MWGGFYQKGYFWLNIISSSSSSFTSRLSIYGQYGLFYIFPFLYFRRLETFVCQFVALSLVHNHQFNSIIYLLSIYRFSLLLLLLFIIAEDPHTLDFVHNHRWRQKIHSHTHAHTIGFSLKSRFFSFNKWFARSKTGSTHFPLDGCLKILALLKQTLFNGIIIDLDVLRGGNKSFINFFHRINFDNRENWQHYTTDFD